jgi:signal transduction histidine kinase/ActR/RegA family two-component response regulator
MSGLSAAPQHCVQLYEDDASVVEAVCAFIAGGLLLGQSVVVIATGSHRRALETRGTARGIDVAAARSSGALIERDAAEILAAFMRDGWPDAQLFQRSMEELMKQAVARSTGEPAPRVFGEMGDVLWASDQPGAALRVEELWNELARLHGLSLLCAYPLARFASDTEGGAFEAVCRQHARVVPSERYPAAGSSAEQLRAVAVLQQKARALEAEVARRTAVEQALLQREAQLREQVQELAALHHLSTGIVGHQDSTKLLQTVLQAAISLQPSQRGFIQLHDPETSWLVPGVAIGHDPERSAGLWSVPVGEGLGAAGSAAARRASVIVEDVEVDPLFAPYRDAARRAGVRAVWSAPLITSRGELFGVLSTHFGEVHRPGERIVRMVELYARFAADAIEAATLYERASEARRRAEEAADTLRRANERKDEFLAMLGHELRNPLAAVQNTLVMAGLDPSRSPHALDIARRQAGQLRRLIDDLLDVARITEGRIQLRREPVALSRAVEGALETLRPLLEERAHRLSVELPDEDVYVDADPARLEQILGNLLSNAAKYTPIGGVIEVAVEIGRDEAAVRISDSGIGIEPEMKARIFDLFVQGTRGLERSLGGLGIGLNVARRLTQLHGGRIEVHSDGVGMGSEFGVYLPLLDGPPAPLDTPAEMPTQRSVRILVVEDNADVAEALAQLLEVLGHRVRTVHQGRAGIEAAREELPELMIVDIGLPEIDGYEVARQVRRLAGGEHAVLVALTGYGMAEDRQKALEAGFDRHLVKPVDPEAIHEIVATVSSRSAE